ncbi:nucleoporin autopeptidase, putative [Entamoeba histolytica HM-1:IMSS-B]|uniref:Nuclear pore protein, putative n=6 Tax=Entamoeba histolytica TaxID=5759 RepID=C4M9Y0_ENTH1|nr:nuclear pore protein, putative [Entamoeba histolytica HM-1:IMSS]EMD43956.1 nucleoporin autopeptidase, putative [Entamoeba histolytica KU27]EMH74629.1 nucleoporin autopeptidase, putative [Entamoeba histolytica HM-1:IMSS-B]EMS17632.1 nucleoporin autopeptidase [Entamoeba histolytica HM-3:IMSS]ENY61200.1 nucleoporin autopeptidase, putative [Entamoeba histolytica HM-1:IMSS-A]GAT98541.1 nuclear pore protein putative [Entamoeba histolytica]|eukprot:XP_651001.1 nuclear pore protein, putative [Entamoeba histolytica HM-1:IMSS]
MQNLNQNTSLTSGTNSSIPSLSTNAFLSLNSNGGFGSSTNLFSTSLNNGFGTNTTTGLGSTNSLFSNTLNTGFGNSTTGNNNTVLLNPLSISSLSIGTNVSKDKQNKEKSWVYHDQTSMNQPDFVRPEEMMFNTSCCIIDPKVIDKILFDAEREIESLQPNVSYDIKPIGLKQGYVCNPSMQTLKAMSIEQLKDVSSFEVSRPGYGKVMWSKVDLTNVNLDISIIIERGYCDVYPDGIQKPRFGEKLNKEATIVLENVVDTVEEFRKLLPRLSKKVDIKSYEENTKTVTFVVPHFTRYSVIDEDNNTQENEKEEGIDYEKSQIIPNNNPEWKFPVVVLHKIEYSPFEIDI